MLCLVSWFLISHLAFIILSFFLFTPEQKDKKRKSLPPRLTIGEGKLYSQQLPANNNCCYYEHGKSFSRKRSDTQENARLYRQENDGGVATAVVMVVTVHGNPAHNISQATDCCALMRLRLLRRTLNRNNNHHAVHYSRAGQ
jgi:hypothetical protein